VRAGMTATVISRDRKGLLPISGSRSLLAKDDPGWDSYRDWVRRDASVYTAFAPLGPNDRRSQCHPWWWYPEAFDPETQDLL